MLKNDIKFNIKYAVDYYGKLDEKIKEMTKIKNEYKQQIQHYIESFTIQPNHLEGKQFELLITQPRKDLEVINKEEIFAILGVEHATQLAKFSIEDLRKWLNPDQLNLVTKEVLGPRSFKAQRID